MPNTNENPEYKMVSAFRKCLYKIYRDVEKAWKAICKTRNNCVRVKRLKLLFNITISHFQ